MTVLWGIDLGGTKIEGAIFEHDNPLHPLARIRHDTEADQGYDHIVSRIVSLIEKLKEESGKTPSMIGFSTPGALDPISGTMKNCNTTALNGRALHADLERALAVPVILQNDANCFALTEASFGAATDQEVVFGVILGTGVGGGIVVNKKVLGGRHGITGEWGHSILVPDGIPCYCGRKGCVENYLAGPRVEDFYLQRAGKRLELSDIAENARKKSDLHAVETIDYLTSTFARAIATVVNILDPSIIVLGGGVSNVEELYSEETRNKVAAAIFNPRFETPLVKNKLGDSAGVFGAGFLCLKT